MWGSMGTLCARDSGNVAPTLGIPKEKCVATADFLLFPSHSSLLNALRWLSAVVAVAMFVPRLPLRFPLLF